MSKFINRLGNLNKSIVTPMGFGRVDIVERPACMLVMVELGVRGEEEINALSNAGISAGLIDISSMNGTALARLVKSSGELPVGLMLLNGKPVVQKLGNGDIDFIVFDPGLPVKTFEGRDLDEIGKVIKLDMSADAGLLRSVNSLYPGVDAVLVDLMASPLTVEKMMACRRMADFSGQPLIARTANSLAAVELAAIRDAGVKCLLLNTDAGAEEVSSMIEKIKSLPKPDRKKEHKGITLIPTIATGFGARKEENEGDDVDDDDD